MKISITLTLAAAITMLVSGEAAAAKKYYISVGCHPDYKLRRIGCDVGTDWKTCARKFCNGIMAPGPGSNAAEVSRRRTRNQGEPRLLAPLPPGIR